MASHVNRAANTSITAQNSVCVCVCVCVYRGVICGYLCGLLYVCVCVFHHVVHSPAARGSVCLLDW